MSVPCASFFIYDVIDLHVRSVYSKTTVYCLLYVYAMLASQWYQFNALALFNAL